MSLFSDARNIVSLTTRHSDLALVGLLVAVIALMIMPLPTALVDTLIGANLALSFAIMMMTMLSGHRWSFLPSPPCCCSPRCSAWA